jgi:hypothetical protein
MSDCIIGRVHFDNCTECTQPLDEYGECPMTEDDIRIDFKDVICMLYKTDV